MTAAAEITPLPEFEDGYALGRGTGFDHGYVCGVADEGAAWTSALTGCTETWRSPRQSDLEAARKLSHAPCRRKCRACSRCIHSLSWYARGRRDYLGVDAEAALTAGAK